MAGYIVVGNSPSKKGTIEDGLNDLKKAAEGKKETLWLIVPLESTPEEKEPIDRVLTWAYENEVWTAVFRKKAVELDDDLKGFLEEERVKADPTATAIERCLEEEDFVGALVLFDDEDEELGDWLADVVAAAGVKKFIGLNIGLEPLAINDDEEEPEPEEDEKPAKSRTRSRKAADEDEDEDEDEPEEKPAKRERKAKDEEPEEEEPTSAPSSDLAELMSQRITSLRKLYKDRGLGDPGDMSKEELAAVLAGSAAKTEAKAVKTEAPAVKTEAPADVVTTADKVLVVVHLRTGVSVHYVNTDAVRALINA